MTEPPRPLEALEPESAEELAVRRAIALHRERCAADELLHELTDRERTIARCAWSRARADALQTILDLIGPAATHVDAAALRAALERIPYAPTFERHELGRVAFGRDHDELELAKDVRELLHVIEGAR